MPMLIPVLVPLVVTLALKLMVLELLPAMVTAVAPLIWLIVPPHEIMPPLPPVTLNVAPLAPVSEPAVAPHEPVTALRFTPFVPPVELTLANVPLTAPVVRTNAFVAETFTEAPIVRVPKVEPLMPVVGPVMVTPARVRLVFAPDSETPVVPPEIVPPFTVTWLAAVKPVRLMPVVAPVVLTLLKVTPEPPMVVPLRLRPAAAAPLVMLAVPLTFRMPAPPTKPLPVLVVIASVPLKVVTEVAPFVVRVTAALVVVPSVCVPVKLIVARLTLLLTAMPVPLSVIAAPMFVIDAAPRFAKLMLRWPALAVIVFVLFITKLAVPPLIVRQNGELLSVVFVMVTLLLGVVSTSAELAAPAAVAITVSTVRPFVVVPAMPLPDVPVTVKPSSVLPFASVTPSPAVLVICGFVPAARSVLALTTSATPWPMSCWLALSVIPAFWPVVVPSPV